MSESMVERVARAIAASRGHKGNGISPAFYRDARAAIEAMREPSTSMQNAGWREIDRQGFATEDTEVAPIFRAMIDAALSD